MSLLNKSTDPTASASSKLKEFPLFFSFKSACIHVNPQRQFVSPQGHANVKTSLQQKNNISEVSELCKEVSN